jgi:hypothetical protein
MSDPKTQRSLDYIAGCTDPDKLRQVASNASERGNEAVREAARRRLYEVLPAEEPDTLEYDVWQSIHALEDTLTHERGKTTRLARTRQKIKRDKEARTVADLILKRASDGFVMLVDRNLPELTFEAVALKHPSRFEDHVLRAATARLKEAGYEPPSS